MIDSEWLLAPTSSSSYPVGSEKIRFAGDGRSVSATMWHPKAPSGNELEHDIVLFCSGWTEKGLSAQAKEVAQSIGMCAVSFDHPRSGALSDLIHFARLGHNLPTALARLSSSVWTAEDHSRPDDDDYTRLIHEQIAKKDKDPANALHRYVIEAGEARRDNIMLIVTALKDAGYRVHLAPHSLGGLDAVMAATALPKGTVESIVLNGTAGAMAQDSIPKIIPRIAGTAVHDVIKSPKNLRVFGAEVAKAAQFVAKNPILTLLEGGYALTGRLEDSLWFLIEKYHLPVVLVQGGQDPLFPENIVSKDTKLLPIAARIVLPEAGHNMTTYQREQIALILGNVALDCHNESSSRLDASMYNLLEVRHRQKQIAELMQSDVERNLFLRND